ncbi:MAG: DUF177 domain-containing protein [Hyphomicrobiales bacterium]|nr:DUF177 domain-containing protein [Hyphomicrobiales bacterium]OQW82413.1 MAG: hypothetical protein BVN31_08595 [Proteobacteria bacterium ST_bin15]
MGNDLSFHRFVRRADVPDAGREWRVEASSEECSRLAEALDLISIESFAADLAMSPAQDGLYAKGHFTCALTYRCVRSLEPFVHQLSEPVERLFLPTLPDEAETSELELSPDDEPPQLMAGEGADIGLMLAEALSLAIDPYPRKPGADLVAETTPQPSLSPFSILSKLKDRESR